MDSKVLFIGGIPGLGKSKYASKIPMLHSKVHHLNLEQMLTYLAEHSFAKQVDDLSPEELDQIGKRCLREVEGKADITLLDGSYSHYSPDPGKRKTPIPVSLQERIDAFILVDADVQTAIWLRERRQYPKERMVSVRVQHELELEKQMAEQMAARLGKKLVIVKRQRNVDFVEVLRTTILVMTQ
ncbi:AAA family ATPase [Candidatus Micrarchaeota archaeon]|nr:AAA family ATPase [Candidatus Micrarchaeota archaeon]